MVGIPTIGLKTTSYQTFHWEFFADIGGAAMVYLDEDDLVLFDLA